MEQLMSHSWLKAEPSRAAEERQRVPEVAPELVWDGENPAGGWTGPLPPWPFDRPQPPGLEEFLAGRRLNIRIEYLQAFPMVEPKFWPLDPVPDIVHRTDARWHVLGDGALCLFQNASDWTGRESAADLIPKAASWFLEFLLMKDDSVDEMTEEGLANDSSRDHLLVPRADR